MTWINLHTAHRVAVAWQFHCILYMRIVEFDTESAASRIFKPLHGVNDTCNVWFLLIFVLSLSVFNIFVVVVGFILCLLISTDVAHSQYSCYKFQKAANSSPLILAVKWLCELNAMLGKNQLKELGFISSPVDVNADFSIKWYFMSAWCRTFMSSGMSIMRVKRTSNIDIKTIYWH